MLEAGSLVAPSVAPPRSTRGRRRDAVYHGVSFAASLVLVLTMIGVLGVLVTTAWPAITQLGFGFFTGTVWNPNTNVYGAVPFIGGTLITTGLALLIAVPLSIAIALLLTEYAPAPVAAVLGLLIDVAAGVPTIVFGAWALLALVPWLSQTGEPAVQAVLGWLPLFRTPDIGYLTGQGMFAAGLVLAAMVFPTIVSVTRNSLLATPLDLREASLAMGATRWETATRVVLRQSRAGVSGAVLLACGRALGETMAVYYVIGASPSLPQTLFDSGYTISTELLTQVYGGGALPGTLYTGALYELGLVLLVLTLATSLISRYLTKRVAGAAVLGAR